MIEYTSADLLILDGMNAFVPVFLESFRPIVEVGKVQIKGVTKQEKISAVCKHYTNVTIVLKIPYSI